MILAIAVEAVMKFPAYLAAIALFVIPIAAAGLLLLPEGTVDRDVTVLALPMSGRRPSPG